jgi:cytochrome oxidase Cu insertion factor (SCO1/SenC/PrrC family)
VKTALTITLALTIALLSVAGGLIARRTSQDRNGTGPPASPYRGSIPPPGVDAPDFNLRSYRGGRVTMRALRGKVVLITFLDTDCKTKCPLIASAIGDGLRRLSAAERRQTVALALTVNPGSDTPASARSFLRRRHALGLDFLLGTIREMRPVWRAFHVVAAAETGNADVHSADVRVFNRRGEWVSTLHLPPDLTPENLAHDIGVALQGGRS